jgi:hypothetical protein
VNTRGTLFGESDNDYSFKGVISLVNGQPQLVGEGSFLSAAEDVSITIAGHTISDGAETRVSGGRLVNLSTNGSVVQNLVEKTETGVEKNVASIRVEFVGKGNANGSEVVVNRHTLSEGTLPADVAARETGERVTVFSESGSMSLKIGGELKGASLVATPESTSNFVQKVNGIKAEGASMGVVGGLAGSVSKSSAGGPLVFMAEGKNAQGHQVVIRDWQSASAGTSYVTDGKSISYLKVNGQVESSEGLGKINGEARSMGIEKGLEFRVVSLKVEGGKETDRKILLQGKRSDGLTAYYEGVAGKESLGGIRATMLGGEIKTLTVGGKSVGEKAIRILNGGSDLASVKGIERILVDGKTVTVFGVNKDGAQTIVRVDTKKEQGSVASKRSDGFNNVIGFRSVGGETRVVSYSIGEDKGNRWVVAVEGKGEKWTTTSLSKEVKTLKNGDQLVTLVLGKGLSAKDGVLTTNLGLLNDVLGFAGAPGREEYATVYSSKHEALGVGVVDKSGKALGYYDRENNKIMRVNGDVLTNAGYVKEIAGLRIAVSGGRLDETFKSLARAAGAMMGSTTGKINIWIDKAGDIRGGAGTQLFLLGKGKSTELRVFSEGGRLFVKSSYVSESRDGVNANGQVVRSQYTSGQYAAMGKNGLTFRHFESYSNPKVLGYVDTLPAGTNVRVLITVGGKSTWATVTLGATDPLEPSPGENQGVRSRSIVPLTTSRGGSEVTITRIGAMTNQASLATDLYDAKMRNNPNITLAIDPKSVVGGLVAMDGTVKSSGGNVELTFTRDRQTGMLSFGEVNKGSLDKLAGQTLVIPAGNGFEVSKVTSYVDISDGRKALLLDGFNSDRIGSVKDASVTSLIFDSAKSGKGSSTVFNGFGGLGTVTVGGRDIQVSYLGKGRMFVVDDTQTADLVTARIDGVEMGAKIKGFEWDGKGGDLKTRVTLHLEGEDRVGNPSHVGEGGKTPDWVGPSENLVGFKGADKTEYFQAKEGTVGKVDALVVAGESATDSWTMVQLYPKVAGSTILAGTNGFEMNEVFKGQTVTYQPDGTRSIQGDKDSLLKTSTALQTGVIARAEMGAVDGSPARLAKMDQTLQEATESGYRLDVRTDGSVDTVRVGLKGKDVLYTLVARAGEGKLVSVQGNLANGTVLFGRIEMDNTETGSRVKGINKAIIVSKVGDEWQAVAGMESSKDRGDRATYKGVKEEFAAELTKATTGGKLLSMEMDGTGAINTKVQISPRGDIRVGQMTTGVFASVNFELKAGANGQDEFTPVSGQVNGKEITRKVDDTGNGQWVGRTGWVGSIFGGKEVQEIVARVERKEVDAPGNKTGTLITHRMESGFEGFATVVQMAEGRNRLEVGAGSGKVVYDALMTREGAAKEYSISTSLGGGRTEVTRYDAQTLEMTSNLQMGLVLSEGAIKNQIIGGDLYSSEGRRISISSEQIANLHAGETVTYGGTEYSGGSFFSRDLKISEGKMSAGWFSETDLLDSRGWATQAIDYTKEVGSNFVGGIANGVLAIVGSVIAYATSSYDIGFSPLNGFSITRTSDGYTDMADQAFWDLGFDRTTTVGDAYLSLFSQGLKVIPVFGVRGLMSSAVASAATGLATRVAMTDLVMTSVGAHLAAPEFAKGNTAGGLLTLGMFSLTPLAFAGVAKVVGYGQKVLADSLLGGLVKTSAGGAIEAGVGKVVADKIGGMWLSKVFGETTTMRVFGLNNVKRATEFGLLNVKADGAAAVATNLSRLTGTGSFRSMANFFGEGAGWAMRRAGLTARSIEGVAARPLSGWTAVQTIAWIMNPFAHSVPTFFQGWKAGLEGASKVMGLFTLPKVIINALIVGNPGIGPDWAHVEGLVPWALSKMGVTIDPGLLDAVRVVLIFAPFLAAGMAPGAGGGKVLFSKETVLDRVGVVRSQFSAVSTSYKTSGIITAAKQVGVGVLEVTGLREIGGNIGRLMTNLSVKGPGYVAMQLGRDIGRGLVTGISGMERTVRDVTKFNAVAYGLGGAINTAVYGEDAQDIVLFGGLVNIPAFKDGFESAFAGFAATVKQTAADPQMWLFGGMVGLFRPVVAPLIQNVPILGSFVKYINQFDYVLGGQWAKGHLGRFHAFVAEEAGKEVPVELAAKALSLPHQASEVLQEMGDRMGKSRLSAASGTDRFTTKDSNLGFMEAAERFVSGAIGRGEFVTATNYSGASSQLQARAGNNAEKMVNVAIVNQVMAQVNLNNAPMLNIPRVESALFDLANQLSDGMDGDIGAVADTLWTAARLMTDTSVNFFEGESMVESIGRQSESLVANGFGAEVALFAREVFSALGAEGNMDQVHQMVGALTGWTPRWDASPNADNATNWGVLGNVADLLTGFKDMDLDVRAQSALEARVITHLASAVATVPVSAQKSQGAVGFVNALEGFAKEARYRWADLTSSMFGGMIAASPWLVQISQGIAQKDRSSEQMGLGEMLGRMADRLDVGVFNRGLEGAFSEAADLDAHPEANLGQMTMTETLARQVTPLVEGVRSVAQAASNVPKSSGKSSGLSNVAQQAADVLADVATQIITATGQPLSNEMPNIVAAGRMNPEGEVLEAGSFSRARDLVTRLTENVGSQASRFVERANLQDLQTLVSLQGNDPKAFAAKVDEVINGKNGKWFQRVGSAASLAGGILVWTHGAAVAVPVFVVAGFLNAFATGSKSPTDAFRDIYRKYKADGWTAVIKDRGFMMSYIGPVMGAVVDLHMLVAPVVTAVVGQARAMVQSNNWDSDRKAVSVWAKLEARGDWTFAGLNEVSASTGVRAERILDLAATARGVTDTGEAKIMYALSTETEKGQMTVTQVMHQPKVLRAQLGLMRDMNERTTPLASASQEEFLAFYGASVLGYGDVLGADGVRSVILNALPMDGNFQSEANELAETIWEGKSAQAQGSFSRRAQVESLAGSRIKALAQKDLTSMSSAQPADGSEDMANLNQKYGNAHGQLSAVAKIDQVDQVLKMTPDQLGAYKGALREDIRNRREGITRIDGGIRDYQTYVDRLTAEIAAMPAGAALLDSPGQPLHEKRKAESVINDLKEKKATLQAEVRGLDSMLAFAESIPSGRNASSSAKTDRQEPNVTAPVVKSIHPTAVAGAEPAVTVPTVEAGSADRREPSRNAGQPVETQNDRLKSEGVPSQLEVKSMTQEQYAQYLEQNGLPDGVNAYDALTAAPQHRGLNSQQRVDLFTKNIGKVREFTQRMAETWSRVRSNNMEDIKAIGVESNWTNFVVGHDTHQSGDPRHKSYASLTDVLSLSESDVIGFLSALKQEGYNGQVKFPGIGARALLGFDNVVMHGATEQDAKKGKAVAKKYFGSRVTGAQFGVDAHGQSHTQLLANRVEKTLAASVPSSQNAKSGSADRNDSSLSAPIPSAPSGHPNTQAPVVEQVTNNLVTVPTVEAVLADRPAPVSEYESQWPSLSVDVEGGKNRGVGDISYSADQRGGIHFGASESKYETRSQGVPLSATSIFDNILKPTGSGDPKDQQNNLLQEGAGPSNRLFDLIRGLAEGTLSPTNLQTPRQKNEGGQQGVDARTAVGKGAAVEASNVAAIVEPYFRGWKEGGLGQRLGYLGAVVILSPIIEGILFLESWLSGAKEMVFAGDLSSLAGLGEMGVLVGLGFALAHTVAEGYGRYRQLNAEGVRGGWAAIFERGAMVQDAKEFGKRFGLFGAGVGLMLASSMVAGPMVGTIVTTVAHMIYNMGTLPKGWFVETGKMVGEELVRAVVLRRGSSEGSGITTLGSMVPGRAAARAVAAAAFLTANPGFASSLEANQMAVFGANGQPAVVSGVVTASGGVEVAAKQVTGPTLHKHGDLVLDGSRVNSSVADMAAFIKFINGRQGVPGAMGDPEFHLISDAAGKTVVAFRIMPDGLVQEARVTSEGLKLIAARHVGDVVREALLNGQDMSGFLGLKEQGNPVLNMSVANAVALSAVLPDESDWQTLGLTVEELKKRIAAVDLAVRTARGSRMSWEGELRLRTVAFMHQLAPELKALDPMLTEILAEARLARYFEQMGVPTREGELLASLEKRIAELEKKTGVLPESVYRTLGVTGVVGARLTQAQAQQAAEGMLKAMLAKETVQGLTRLAMPTVRVVLHENSVSFEQSLAARGGKDTDNHAKAFVVAGESGYVIHTLTGDAGVVMARVAHEVGHIPTLVRFGRTGGASEMVVQYRIGSSLPKELADMSLLGLLKEIQDLNPTLARRGWLSYSMVTALAETLGRSANGAYWMEQLYQGRMEMALMIEAIRQSQTSLVMVAATDLISNGRVDKDAVQKLRALAAARLDDSELSTLKILVVNNGLSVDDMLQVRGALAKGAASGSIVFGEKELLDRRGAVKGGTIRFNVLTPLIPMMIGATPAHTTVLQDKATWEKLGKDVLTLGLRLPIEEIHKHLKAIKRIDSNA